MFTAKDFDKRKEDIWLLEETFLCCVGLLLWFQILKNSFDVGVLNLPLHLAHIWDP
jgi:hypothetical protein